MAKRKAKSIPEFRSEAQEREFWATHDSSDYVDWAQARRTVYADLKPSTETISLRLPASLLADLKILANRMDVPYQSLLKMFLADRVGAELGRGRTAEELSSMVREPEEPYGKAPKGTHRKTPSRRSR
jgi:predicted DNA binding CopG/RHH family protein